MENNNIFSYIDYLAFIRKMLDMNARTYGYKAKLAAAAGCQRSFLSQVLSGSTHLTVEHAEGLGNFWQLRKIEKEYFLNLVLLARAGSKSLKEFLRQKINDMRRDQENLAKRITEKTILPDENAAIFYSNWQYLAVVILLTIPEFRTVESIARRLNLKNDIIKKTLQDLEALGLAVRSDDIWLATSTTIHVPRDSKFNSLNHTHWRNQAVQNSFLGDEESVHYTSVCSLSRADAEKMKQLMFQLIDESRKLVAPSKEEELFCLTCDWFKV